MPQNKYGVDEFGRLKKVLVHRPDSSLKKVTDDNYRYFLFDKKPDVDKYLEEHHSYTQLLKSNGVEVFELSEYITCNTDLMNCLPNLAYMHDTAAISRFGTILSKMSSGGRQHEELVVKEALQNIGIPIFYEFDEGEKFESCIILSPKTLLIADTERHSKHSIMKLVQFALEYYEEVIFIEVPQERRFMHADMIISRAAENLMLVYLPAFLHSWYITRGERKEINFREFMKERGVDLYNLSDEEQIKWGCSFVAIEPGKIINYDISLKSKTLNALSQYGVEFIHFHPEALLAGGGSLRCLTLKLWRDAIPPSTETWGSFKR